MAYFPNGTAGMLYEEKWCCRCIHDREDKPCAVMLAHNLYNYDECNKPESILHLLIPIGEDGLGNEECRMFAPKSKSEAREERAGMAADEKYREWQEARKHGLDQGTRT